MKNTDHYSTCNNELDFSLVDNYEAAVKFWKKNDITGLLTMMPNQYGLKFIVDNFEPIYKKGLFEEGLLYAYIGCSSNWCSYSTNTIKWLFDLGKKELFRKYSDTLPGPGPFKIYRGISGVGSKRKKRGLSWTASFEKAKWFAERFSMLYEKPMVYMTVIEESLIYAYINNRNEQEFLCNIPRDLKLKKVWP